VKESRLIKQIQGPKSFAKQQLPAAVPNHQTQFTFSWDSAASLSSRDFSESQLPPLHPPHPIEHRRLDLSVVQPFSQPVARGSVQVFHSLLSWFV
jgi:hypothetical protein